MKKINNLLYLTDDIIYLKNTKLNNVIKYKINKNTILNGKVFKVEKFLKTYTNLLNKYNLNNNIFGDTIKIIINPFYTPADVYFLQKLMEKFNYRKIIFELETKKYKLNNQNAYLNINDNYAILTYIDEYKKTKSFLIPENFFVNTDDLLKYIKSKINNKEIYIIGKGEIMSQIFQKFENKYKNKTYIYSENELFLLN